MDISETFWLLLGIVLVLSYLGLVVYVAWDLHLSSMATWAKVAWIVSFLVLPVLSVITYVVARGSEPRPYPKLGGDRHPM